MWEAQLMCAGDGLRPRKPARTETATTLECTSISWMGAQPMCTQEAWTLVNHVDTCEGGLANAGHQGGAKCRCDECLRLKSVEDKWICKLGAFHGPSGLNTRDEIKARSRVNFVGN